jgi:copper chaperone for superoxide dismutase
MAENYYQILLKKDPTADADMLMKQDDTVSIHNENGEYSLTCSPTKLALITQTLNSMGYEYKIVGNPNALVCIFEFFKGAIGFPEKHSKGLARIVPITHKTLMVDGSLSGLEPGHYSVSLRQYGDLSLGVKSTGAAEIILADCHVQQDGVASFSTIIDGEIWQWIGKSICLERGEESICGILARSAGVFENTKRVCSCSGKTIWEE